MVTNLTVSDKQQLAECIQEEISSWVNEIDSNALGEFVADNLQEPVVIELLELLMGDQKIKDILEAALDEPDPQEYE
jgi:hypothetical protein